MTPDLLNPYSAPTEMESGNRSVRWDTDGALLVPTGVKQVTLPPICWATGQIDDLDSRDQTLRTATKSQGLFFTGGLWLGTILGLTSRQIGSDALSNLGLFFLYVSFFGYFVFMKRVTARMFVARAIRDEWNRIRWTTYGGFGAVVLLALGAGQMFGVVGALVAAGLGSAAMVVVTKFRLSPQARFREVGTPLAGRGDFARFALSSVRTTGLTPCGSRASLPLVDPPRILEHSVTIVTRPILHLVRLQPMIVREIEAQFRSFVGEIEVDGRRKRFSVDRLVQHAEAAD